MYQTFAIFLKVHTPYTTHPPLPNCVARLGVLVKLEVYDEILWKRGAISPFIHNILLPDVRFLC